MGDAADLYNEEVDSNDYYEGDYKMANTVEKATIDVEFVNTKPKYPRFSSGSVKLTDGSWLAVSKDVDINYFHKGIHSVEIEVNEQGYQSVTRLFGDSPKIETKTASKEKTERKERDFDAEARGKSRFGLYAAALQSPALATLTFNGTEELKKLVRELAEDGMDYTFQGQ